MFVGRSLGYMMNSLGIAPSRAIKIRRRITPRKEEDRNVEENQSSRQDPDLKRGQSSDLFDQRYLRQFLPFWRKGDGHSHGYGSEVPNQYNQTNTEEGKGILFDLTISYPIDTEDPPLLDSTIEYQDLIAPPLMETLAADDIIFISSAQDVVEKLMKSIAGESKGLYILKSNVLSLPGITGDYWSDLISIRIWN